MFALLQLTLLFWGNFVVQGRCNRNVRSTEINLNDFIIVNDFEKYAEKYMQKANLAYIQSGAILEQTLKENTDAFFRYRLQHKLLRDTSKKDISTTILGKRLSIPICICPNALQSLFHYDAENATTRAVESENTLMILSVYSSLSLEEVAANSSNTNRWFQIQSFKNRTVMEDLLIRAKRSGYTAIVLTADCPVLGFRIRTARTKLEFKKLRFGNFEKYGRTYMEEAPTLIWSDLTWLKAITGLPLIIKGILTAEDAALAVQNGADAIIVSTHGGRQLDGVPASIEALPDVVKAVNGQVEVYLDSGVRTGSDVVKALALGARAVFIGRPNLYGLFAGGEMGSRRVLQILIKEMTNVMDLIGAANITDFDNSYIKREEYYRRPLH